MPGNVLEGFSVSPRGRRPRMPTWSGQHRLPVPLTAWDSPVLTDRRTRAPTSRSATGMMLSLNHPRSRTRSHERCMTPSLTWGPGGAVSTVTIQGGGPSATQGWSDERPAQTELRDAARGWGAKASGEGAHQACVRVSARACVHTCASLREPLEGKLRHSHVPWLTRWSGLLWSRESHSSMHVLALLELS